MPKNEHMRMPQRQRQNNRARSGQVMILAITTIGATLLGATAIAGLLMTYQIRQTADVQASTKAIFAADAGIEWGFYDFNCHTASPFDTTPQCHTDVSPPGDLSFVDADGVINYVFDLDGSSDLSPHDVSYRVTRLENSAKFNDYNIASTTEDLVVTGVSGPQGRASSRAFELTLQ